MKRHTWHVWTEDDSGRETILFSGSERAARSYYKRHGGQRAGLHFGYFLD